MLELTTDALTDLSRSGARLGFGLFETLRVEGGEPRFLGSHLERLGRGAAFLGMEPPPGTGETRRFLEDRAGIAALASGVLRLIAVDGRLVAAFSAGIPPTPARVAVAVARSVVRLSSSPLNRFKTISRLENELLSREASSRGLFDAVAPNERGELTDGSRTSLFLVLDGGILTPREEDGALPGVARRALIESGFAREARLLPGDLGRCGAAFLANALRGVMSIGGMDGAELDPWHRAIDEARACLDAAARAEP